MGYNLHTYRPPYPYPDYTFYKAAPVTRFNSHGGQIQIVPCMCPVSVAASSAMRHAAMSPEGRTTSGEEDDLMGLARADELNLPAESSMVTERTEQETADADKSKSELEVTAKAGVESEITENLLQKGAETVVDQLSTNKVDEQSRDAVEERSDGKQKDA